MGKVVLQHSPSAKKVLHVTYINLIALFLLVNHIVFEVYQLNQPCPGSIVKNLLDKPQLLPVRENVKFLRCCAHITRLLSGPFHLAL